MNNKRTLFLGVAVTAVMAIPAVAWALNGPLAADPLPAEEGSPVASTKDDLGGWMGHMHDHMWNDGELPEDFPADAADWMNQMRDYMWGDAPLDGSYGWMGQMHDYMWNNGELPEDFPADAADWMNQMRDYMWGGGGFPAQVDPGYGDSPSGSPPSGRTLQGAASAQPVPGPGWGGCGMWGGR